mmetsp:Transcript_14945/g.46506  ORF Transcript_14945/g.46506 Transcript_14945/m.46506 type:complete len:213 (-) Transcript_14945:139-777(-)
MGRSCTASADAASAQPLRCASPRLPPAWTHSATCLSSPAVTKRSPEACIARPHTVLAWPAGSTPSPSSPPPPARTLAPGDPSAASGTPSVCVQLHSSSPSGSPHTLTVLSYEADSSTSLVGCQQMSLTSAPWPDSTAAHSNSLSSSHAHTHTVLSRPHVASSSPPAPQATALTSDSCPSSTATCRQPPAASSTSSASSSSMRPPGLSAALCS